MINTSKLFPPIPLNTDNLFVMQVASSGCEIYIPVTNRSITHTHYMKNRLREYLDSQVPYSPPKEYA